MKNFFHILSAGAMALALPAAAFAQNGSGQIQGFGGFTLRGVNPATTFGGNVAVPLGDHVQIIGEGGRMSDLTWAPLSGLLDFAPFDARVSAFYGEAGVRVLGPSNRVVRPYAEATAGMARMHVGISGIGTRTDPILNAALSFLDSTQPILGAGAGVLVQGGPVVVDFGYRYHRIGSGNPLPTVLTGGKLDVQQVRLGVGFRF
jgi:opacity protein-like surface antigen